jgi:hypothetical protein
MRVPSALWPTGKFFWVGSAKQRLLVDPSRWGQVTPPPELLRAPLLQRSTDPAFWWVYQKRGGRQKPIGVDLKSSD